MTTTDKLDLDTLEASLKGVGNICLPVHATQLLALIARIRELESACDSLASTLTNVDVAVRDILGISQTADDALPELVADWMENRAAPQPAAAPLIKLKDALETIADLYSYEATVGEMSSAMYEARCIALNALRTNSAEREKCRECNGTGTSDGRDGALIPCLACKGKKSTTCQVEPIAWIQEERGNKHVVWRESPSKYPVGTKFYLAAPPCALSGSGDGDREV
ncbi:hypothetical protein [Cupriavidus sp. UYPR2.512]|uniref:hypothetical protein n=1 Tax=Cupriavidus sp. UYPR2.512 TaxID=1080187 RepID=UPI00036340C0|nr:hypothetical protein [Cupriavidus sp. UYPR2.512]UIF90914.1 hypothetical protein KAF44_32530 [Cupriavidus necator]